MVPFLKWTSCIPQWIKDNRLFPCFLRNTNTSIGQLGSFLSDFCNLNLRKPQCKRSNPHPKCFICQFFLVLSPTAVKCRRWLGSNDPHRSDGQDCCSRIIGFPRAARPLSGLPWRATTSQSDCVIFICFFIGFEGAFYCLIFTDNGVISWYFCWWFRNAMKKCRFWNGYIFFILLADRSKNITLAKVTSGCRYEDILKKSDVPNTYTTVLCSKISTWTFKLKINLFVERLSKRIRLLQL